jgi:hypothetical protein
MKAIKTLLGTKAIAAAAIAMSGIAAPTLSHASPDDGSVCRVGYGAQFANGNMKCTKQVIRFVSLDCTDARFPNRLIRTPGIAGDRTNGRDMCLRPGIVLGSNQPATGLTEGQDFVFVKVNQAKVVALREAVEKSEETTLGVGPAGVDARSTGVVDINGGIGAEDRVRATITLFTFPIPAPTLVKLPIQIDAPVVDLPIPPRIQP